MPALRGVTRRDTDPAGALKELSEVGSDGGRERKLELWGELKVLALTRCTCNLVGSVLLVLLLRVQMAVLGGRLYQETAERRKDKTAWKTQEAFLALCGRLATSRKLFRKVREKVEAR